MRILCIGAHPDDLEYGCAGTARSAVRRGAEALFLVLTHGERGGDKDAREREQKASCDVLGVEYKNIGLPDLGVENTYENHCKLYRVADDFMPTHIFTHAPRDKHPDHIATTLLAESIANRLGVPVTYFRSFSTLVFEPDCTFLHNCADEKRAALHCHKSQIDKYAGRGIDFVSMAMQDENVETYEVWRKN